MMRPSRFVLPLLAVVFCSCEANQADGVAANRAGGGASGAEGGRRATSPDESQELRYAHPPQAEEIVIAETEVDREALKETAFNSDGWNSAVGLGGGRVGESLRQRRLSGDRRVQSSGAGDRYEAIVEHDWKDPRETPMSTFGIDVDGASFANVRRFLESGSLPPTNAMRVEEAVNWFRYEPTGNERRAGELPVYVATELFASPWDEERRLLRVHLRTDEMEREDVPPCNLVFLCDVSGSMSSADKLGLLKRGLRLATEEMRPQDTISIVTYAGRSSIHLEPTPGDEQGKILDAIDSLSAGGSTNGGAGILDAYKLAQKHQTDESVDRVLLATDGDFNVGISDRESLIELITKQKEQGIFLTVLGFGRGNLNDANCEALANKGNGNYEYIDSINEARRVLVEQFGANFVTVAKDVKVQIEFNPAFVQAYRQVGYENRKLAARDFNDDKKDGGEMGAGHQVTALYEIVPPGARLPIGRVDDLRYQDNEARTQETPREGTLPELCLLKVRAKAPDAKRSERFDLPLSPELSEPSVAAQRAATVAAFALLLRESDHLGDYSFDDVLAAHDKIDGPDRKGHWALFRRLVTTARDLVATEPSRR